LRGIVAGRVAIYCPFTSLPHLPIVPCHPAHLSGNEPRPQPASLGGVFVCGVSAIHLFGLVLKTACPRYQSTIMLRICLRSARPSAGLFRLLRLLGILAVPSENERVELEMQITKYRQIISRTNNAEFQRQAEEKIRELERKLREIDG